MNERLPLNELFQTLQGEAHWTGTPSVFVRLQGCEVGCPWCDTRHTWPIEESLETSLSSMLAKTSDSSKYAVIGMDTLVAAIRSHAARHVVITGGEPCQYDLTDLTSHLIEAGYSVQIETSGTEPIRAHDRTWVTVSPKIGMPGGKTVLAEAIYRANEIKVPVGRQSDIDRFRALMLSVSSITDIVDANAGPPPIIWLQPLSQNRKATELCIAAATDNGWRVSIQTHRFLGIR